MTKDELIKLAEIAGVMVSEDGSGVLHQFKFAYPSPWCPHFSLGLVHLREVWNKLSEGIKDDVSNKMLWPTKKDFLSFAFNNPAELCKLILEAVNET